jgi:hypothetical protein
MSPLEQSPTAALATPTRLLLECGDWGFPFYEDPMKQKQPVNPQPSVYYMPPIGQQPPTPPSMDASFASNFTMPVQQQQTPVMPPQMSAASAPSPPNSRKRKSVSDTQDGETDDQRQKLLERNRVAASKCRQKKKKWVQDLEARSDQVHARNKELQQLVSQLREETIYLRNQLLAHGNCDCSIVQTYLRRSSAQLTSGAPQYADAAASAVASAVVDMTSPGRRGSTATSVSTPASEPSSKATSTPETTPID